ncbi:hypothetical protein CRUP_004661, partial [Coryphaenoides rupestris]
VPEEGAHRVRLAAGSGLRPDVWREFARRFGNIRIREGYGLTEASLGFLNYTEEVGPIGRASYFNKLSMPFELLKYDPKTYDPIRDDSGSQFLGYAGNKVQSEKKVLRDVVLPGDEVNVYGVTVPGYEGRVGMAAIILKPDHQLDGAEIYNH